MSRRALVIGLDFETSGTDHDRHVPIQIGLARPNGDVFTSLVGGWRWKYSGHEHEYEWSAEAEGIHGIAQAALDDAPPAAEVDREAARFVAKTYPGAKSNWVIAVGWNVAGFDLPFLRKWFPKTQRSMSYRSIDLNALVFGITESGMERPTGMAWDYYDLKRHVKNAAADRIARRAYALGETTPLPSWHDAGYDALASLYAYDALRDVLRGAHR